jgi:hypothetical protein
VRRTSLLRNSGKKKRRRRKREVQTLPSEEDIILGSS